MEEEILQEIGLTVNEAKIYMALLKSGPCLVSRITNETKLNRTHIYDRLGKLLEKGMVSYVIQSGKKYFKASSPEKLLDLLEEKQKKFKSILPMLLSIPKQDESVEIEIYQGREGLKTLLQDILKTGKEILVLGFTGAVEKELPYFYPHFQDDRVKHHIKRKILADYKMKNSDLLKHPLTESKLTPKGYQNPSGMWIYGEKTVIFIPEVELRMILIKSKKVSDFYKNYFDYLWSLSKKND